MTHHHAHPPASFHQAFAIGVFLNTAFVAIEGFYGWKVNSLALLADAGHNLSDVAGLLLAWGASWVGGLHPNARHTYGWRRGTIMVAFANAALLLVAMGSLGWEALGRLRNPEPTDGTAIIVVASIGISGGFSTWRDGRVMACPIRFARGRPSIIRCRRRWIARDQPEYFIWESN